MNYNKINFRENLLDKKPHETVNEDEEDLVFTNKNEYYASLKTSNSAIKKQEVAEDNSLKKTKSHHYNIFFEKKFYFIYLESKFFFFLIVRKFFF